MPTASAASSSCSFLNSAPQQRVSRIPSVVLVEDGRKDSEGILLVKGGIVTPPSKLSVSQTASRTALKSPTKSSTENTSQDHEVNSEDCTSTGAGPGPNVNLSSDRPGDSTRLRTTKGLVKVVTSAVKWKSRAFGRKAADQTIAKDPKHQQILDRQVIRACTEIPRPLLLDVLEEALPIVQKTLQIYTSELGVKDPLTIQATLHLEKLKERLGKNTVHKTQ
jgi:hypothetical protein